MTTVVVVALLADLNLAFEDDGHRNPTDKAAAAEVSACVGGKRPRFPAGATDRLAAAALQMLASCSVLLDEYDEVDWEKAQEGDHVHIRFARTRTVTVMEKKEEVPELIVTLPRASGAIWVRSHGRVHYFSKYSIDASERFRACIEAGKPAP